MPEILTPNCSLCGQPPLFSFGGEQAFCGNDDCALILWDPSVSLEDNLMDAGVVQFPEEGTVRDD